MSKLSILNREYFPLRALDDPNISCAFSCRAFNNMSLFHAETSEVLDNRKTFLEILGINYKDLICMKQVHGDSVRYVNESDRGRGALNFESSVSDIDALITDKKNLPIAVFTADCLSIFLYDPKSKAIGITHAGWRGSKVKIAVRTVELMQEEFGTRIKDLNVGFGPAIRSCCYEVGEDFKDDFPDSLVQRENRFYLDLIDINKKQLFTLGVARDKLFDSGVCTSCRNEGFFSHRQEKNSEARIISVIMLK